MTKKFHRIMVPIDLSECSEASINTAIDHFEADAEKIIVLSVYEGAQDRYFGHDQNTKAEVDSAMQKAAQENLEAFKEKVHIDSPKVEMVSKKGHPANVILNTAKEMDVDLIVLESQGKSSTVKRMLFGSTAHQVTEQAHCSTFIMR